MDGMAQGRWTGVRQWAPFALAFLVVAALTFYDQHLKTGTLPPYAPEDAAWLAAAPDAPALWASFSNTEPGQAISDELSRQLNDVSLAIRKATGIRPTPRRWRVWLGAPVLAGKTTDAWGLCVRPGLLLRFADWALGASTESPGIRRLGRYWYAWRDGCLIAGSAENYVQRALVDPPRSWPPLEADALRILNPANSSVEVVVHASPGIPFEATLNTTLPAESGPLDLRAWPQSPLAVITAANGATLQACLAAIATASGLAPVWAGLDPVWRHRIEAGWQIGAFQDLLTGIDTSASLALFPLDLGESLPVPSFALAWEESQNGRAVALGKTLDAVPYEWGACSGWLAPFLYQALAPCWCEDSGVSLVASREQLMAQLAGQVTSGTEQRGVVALQVDWAAVSKQGGDLLTKALKLDLLPGTDERAAIEEAQPWLNTLLRLGQLVLVAEESNGVILVSGHASRVPAP